MKGLIYYPTFEPQSINWLKYSLLYIDQFSPIVPIRGSNQVTDVFKKISQETDLVNYIQPNYGQGVVATINAISQIEQIKTNPNLFKPIFKSENVIESWQNNKIWDTLLYAEKFSDQFLDYCLNNKLASIHPLGLITSNGLAGLYMTFLAEQIAFDNQASPITDLESLDNLSSFLRSKDVNSENKLTAAQTILTLKLPQEIESIKIEKFITFRNNSHIRHLRIAFNKTVESFYESVEKNFDPYTYLQDLSKTNLEYIKEIGLLFGGLTSATLGAVVLMSDLDPNKFEIAKQIVEGSILALTGTVAVNHAWKLGKDRKNARKFLSKVRKLDR